MPTKAVPSSQPTTPTVPPASPQVTRIVETFGALDPADQKQILAAISRKPALKFPVPRTMAGGIAESMSIDDVLEAFMEREQDDWTPYPGRYYFSKIGNCFLKEWAKEKGWLCDHGMKENVCSTCRFDAGKSAPGHAAEYWLQNLMEQVYTKGKPGSVLKDIRISKEIRASKTEVIYLVGKTDMLVVGDNFVVKEFMELKTAVFWKREKTEFAKKHGKNAPLFFAGIEEPKRPGGLANLNNALQLAVGVKVLRDAGIKVELASLVYMSRERYRDYVRILLSDTDVDYLFDWSVEWLLRHHENVKSDTPPAPEFMMGYECRNCPFAVQCDRLCKETKQTRQISSMVVGINQRLAETSGTPARLVPSDAVPGGNKGLDGKPVYTALGVMSADEKADLLEAEATGYKGNRRPHPSPPSVDEALKVLKATASGPFPRDVPEQELRDQLTRYFEYGVPQDPAIRTVLRHYGLEPKAKQPRKTASGRSYSGDDMREEAAQD